MPKKIRICEIADALNISSTTVSRALSGKGRVSEHTRKKVLDYIKSKEAIPTVHTEKKARHTHNIAVTVPKEEDYCLLPYFTQVIMNVYDYFEPLGYRVMIVKTSADDITALQDIVKKHRCDGVILSRTIENALDIEYLKDMRIPFVVIGSYNNNHVYQVDVDQRKACCDMTSVFLQRGFRMIALFGAERTHVVTQSRYIGFAKAYEEMGLDVDQSLVFYGNGYQKIAEEQTEKVIKHGVEAIICMDDNICIHVLNALHKFGVNIPNDISVASFYDSQVLEECHPPVSAVSMDIRGLVTKASMVLFDILEGKRVKKRQLLGYEILLRESIKNKTRRKEYEN